VIDADTREALAAELRRRRAALLKEVADTEADLAWIAEDREPELEEVAQEQRLARLLARLDDRGLAAVQEIEAALRLIIAGTYGICVECGEDIAVARLRALPTATLCIECAREGERARRPAAEEEAAQAGRTPPDFADLTDLEAEAALREQIRADPRIDAEELRIVCRHGVVYLDGSLPSEVEHQMVLKSVQDVAGFQEVVDHVRVEALAWQREDRTRRGARTRRASAGESVGTEDVRGRRGSRFIRPTARRTRRGVFGTSSASTSAADCRAHRTRASRQGPGACLRDPAHRPRS
jgi:DnaK suppressor protein